MAKKKTGKISVGTIVAGIAILLGIAAIVMMFVPQLNYQSATGLVKGDPLNGMQITFGYSTEVLGSTVTKLDFSFMNLLTYILALVGIVFAVLALMGKLGKIAPIVAAAAFIVSGVFFFCAEQFMVVHVGDLTGDAAQKVSDAFKELYTLGAGAIVGGILSILAGVSVGAKVLLK